MAAWWLDRDSTGSRGKIAAWWVSALALVSLRACVSVGHVATPSLLVEVGLAVTLAIAAPWQPTRRWLWLATWALGVVGHVAALFSHRSLASHDAARWVVAPVALIGPAALATWVVLSSVAGSRTWMELTVTIVAAWVMALGWARSGWVRDRWMTAGANVDFTRTVQTWLAGMISAGAMLAHTEGDVQVAWFAGATGAAIAVAPRGFAAVVLVATSFPVCGLLQANSPVARQSIDVSNLDLGFGAVAARAVIAVVFARTLPDGGLWASQKRRAVRAWIFPVSGLGLIFSLMVVQIGELRPYITVGWGWRR